ncbi:MAG: hypothetical protein AAFN11_01590 [Chloroflexota bacterium]
MREITVLIFRGTGGVRRKDHPYHSEPALVRAGHVGISGIIEGKIIGFHPTPEIAEELGGETALITKLEKKEAQPGRLQDDDAFFERASELATETNGRTSVFMYTFDISDKTLDEIRSWYHEKREALYNFPEVDGQFRPDEYNCAMFWTRFGIELPIKTGSLKRLSDKMRTEEYDTWSKS